MKLQIGDRVKLKPFYKEIGQIINITKITKHAFIVWEIEGQWPTAQFWPLHALQLYEDAIDKLDDIL